MKQVILSVAIVAAGLVTAGAQGTIKFYNATPAYDVTVNGANIPTSTSAPKAYYFTVLFDTSTPTSSNPLTGGWADVTSGGTPVIGNNYLLAGGISGTGGNGGTAVDGVAAGNPAYFEVVGWSASLGTTWSSIASQLNSGVWSAAGYYGTSAYGFVTTGGSGTPTAPAAALFGAAPLITSGFALAPVATPEPTSIALGVMGGLSLLALRRKKA